MMNMILTLLAGNSFFRILLIAVALDTILGVLRAIREHKFNSCVGIDGQSANQPCCCLCAC